jgi:hypothetical protein
MLSKEMHMQSFLPAAARVLGTTGAAWLLMSALALAGCATAPTPVATVSASESVLAAAGRAVLACYAVPACATVAPKAQIKSAFDAAYTAVTAAQATADAGGSPDLTAATAALSALSALVAQLPPTS